MQGDLEFDQRMVGRERRARDLPTFYYHGHFVEMLDFVERHYAHVLDTGHREFLEQFRGLSQNAQRLYVRLYNRKGRVFSSSRLNYPELGDLAPLRGELRASGWIGAPTAEHFDEVLKYLKRDVIRDVLSLTFTGLGRSMKKTDLVVFARANADPETFVSRACDDRIFVQRRAGTIAYLAFLYFGRVQDGLDRFTMRDLGLVRVHEFGDAFEPRFQERDEALEHFYFASRLHGIEKADDFTARRLADEAASWPEPSWPAAAKVRDKLLYRLGRHFEKSGDPERALACYSRAEAPRCTERLVRLLFQAGRRAEAKQHLERCLDDPRSDEEWLFASDLYERKFNAKRTSALTDMLRAADVIDLDESLSGNPERAVADHYESQGATAFRTENSLWRTLFGLLFWDELFAGSKSSLHSPFDFLPQSLNDGSFADLHADAIDARLGLLENPAALRRHLLKISTQHYGTMNGVFRWRRSVLDALHRFVEVAPAAATRRMLENLCSNYRASRYGYPDLTIIDDSGVRFVEVKAEGDQLRRNQLLRLRQLQDAGFDAGIARVCWTLDPKTVYVVVDVETTGGRGEHHRVTEIGAVKVQGGKVIDRFSTLLNPQRSIPPGITRLTGISADMVADAPYFADVADRFEAFMGDAIFVAHNVEFDYGFISREFARLGRRFRYAKLCTCASMRRLYPGHRSYSLNALCSAYDIQLKSHHRALCDAEAAAELLLLVNEKRAEQLSV
ncbi:MAG: exonuclease domain-containing protein [Woeseiaceae bacterium]|nr:exonuclease domain-containing protein [Woeseiaceae bacterium]